MPQFYSDPSREKETHALPDCEAFDVREGEMVDDEGEPLEPGWYYWYCFPGCMPEGPPMGPYSTEYEAITACRNDAMC